MKRPEQVLQFYDEWGVYAGQPEKVEGVERKEGGAGQTAENIKILS